MAGARHFVVALLAVLGLLAAVPPTSDRASCTMQPSTMMTMHHQHRAPSPAGPEISCAACIGILPSLSLAERHVVTPAAQFDGQHRPLSGIDPAIDPPPPRAA
jgi:hypothetical protein